MNTGLTDWHLKLEQSSLLQVSKLSFCLVFLLGLLDYATGYEASFAFFYLIPVSLAVWYGHRYLSYLVGSICAATGQISNDLAGEFHSHFLIAIWNDLLHFSFFLVVAQLLHKLKLSLEHAQRASQQDFLTGLMNRRALKTRLSAELSRASRFAKPITIGFLDLDHFKRVNDELGHSEGDRLLYLVSKAIQKELRRSDLLSRVGGDEFVITLTECSAESAHLVATKVLRVVQNLSTQNGWRVSASLGLLHLESPRASEDVDSLLNQADGLMYQAKSDGRNTYRLQIRA